MPSINTNIKGLTTQQVLYARQKHGNNTLSYQQKNGFIDAVKSLIKEPMVILLMVAALIYFISGQTGDGIFLASAIVLVGAISLYQDARSRIALEKLKEFTGSHCTVIRDGNIQHIKSDELVIGDSLVVEEGNAVAADGTIMQANDFSVNEAILTGESLPLYKDPATADHFIYMGTTVAGGLAIATVTAIGNQTKLGKIGKSLESITEEKTPLERQINNFVTKMVVAGAVIFVFVWIINYNRKPDILDSLLKALTLAMSVLPEEIPVAFTTFMALGAWRLMRMGIVVKQMKTVETLGSATVICVDKTGTITQNKMSLAKLYMPDTNTIRDPEGTLSANEKELIRLAMWASEPIPFDPMEKALHHAYAKLSLTDERPLYQMIHEYPLSGKPPMMTHLFENAAGHRIIAAKGAPEALMQVSELSTSEKKNIEAAINQLAGNGYRTLAVGISHFAGSVFPEKQQALPFTFKGLVAFYDPPKDNISTVLQNFYQAGIKVKIITGDSELTTAAIANQVNFTGADKCITGNNLLALNHIELQKTVLNTNVFSRMFPEAKLKVINALKAQNQIVAMTGDGVNDGPALKAAHIGIAMGNKGSEIAKEAASLILIEDDLSKMVDAVAMGRRIYDNLKKAIRYIISIHIPIILTVFIPLALGWVYPNIFSPIHIIFLELVMGPTCSVIYENEPMEKNTMQQKPRVFSTTFFNWKELTVSVIQGLIITCGSLLTYQIAVQQGLSQEVTRAMVFATLISANIFLTLVNRSFYYSVFTTLGYKNNLVALIISVTIIITGLLLYVRPLASFFSFNPLLIPQLATAFIIGFISVIWYEFVKWNRRIKTPPPSR